MDTPDDKDMLMRKLAIYEFACRYILYLIFESLSIYCLQQKRLVEMICYFKIVKPNILMKRGTKMKKSRDFKIKAEKEKIKKNVWVKHQCRNCRWWRGKNRPKELWNDLKSCMQSISTKQSNQKFFLRNWFKLFHTTLINFHNFFTYSLLLGQFVLNLYYGTSSLSQNYREL